MASLPLDFEGFRKLAMDERLSVHEKIGFPPAYREGFEAAIFDDILTKLPRLASDEGLSVVDIGPGCAGLPRRLIDLCRERGHRLLLVDSPEMLNQLPDGAGVGKCAGLFELPWRRALQQAKSAGALGVTEKTVKAHVTAVLRGPGRSQPRGSRQAGRRRRAPVALRHGVTNPRLG
ncbi:MAG: hypothetical protein WDM85_10385 [Caulobacteraceae bacterium]